MKKKYQSAIQKEKSFPAVALFEARTAAKNIVSLAFTFMLSLILAFQINGQTPTLLTPNGGETWMNGTTQTISWEWDGSSLPVYIYYSSNDGQTWVFLGNTDANTTSVDINIYLNESNSSKIKITSLVDESIYDESDDNFSVITNPVFFISPMPGDQLYSGQNLTIIWDSFMFSGCDLDFSSDGGQTWTNITENEISNVYDWTIPVVTSDRCILKVTDAGDPENYGLSANFSITEAPTATFTSPVGGDVWNYGDDITMSWTGTNLPEIVYFDYSLDGGLSWNYMGYANSGPTSGSTPVNVPKFSTTNAKIRMLNADYNVVIGMTESFTIYVPPVIVFSPYEGQEFYVGAEAIVYWVVNGVDLVKIEFSQDGGENWDLVESNVDADQYSFSWTISGSPSDNCRIKITDVSDPDKFDISGKFSTVEAPVITLTSPAGNELLKTESIYTVSWSYGNPEFYYLVAEFSADNGATWTNIASGMPAQGSVDWKTPAFESDQCLVRIYDANLLFVADTSEVFEIRDYPDTPICIVSVDSTTNQNIIIWEKPVTDQIRDYIVYKETNQMDVFEPIGTVSYDSEPFFVDVNSNPTIKSYRYKLGFDDSEGYVYPMGDMHQTIHLTISKGIGNSWNLNWGKYLGFDVSSYKIYRSSNGSGYELIQTISSSFFSFTDIEAPAGNVYYFIEVEKENGCNLSTREFQVSSAISNIVTNNFLSVETPDEPLVSNIFPNPSSQWLNVVTGSETGNLQLQLFDIAGRVILADEYEQIDRNFQARLDVGSIQNGIYFLKVSIGKFSEMRKVVVRH